MAKRDFTEFNKPFLSWLDAQLASKGWDEEELARRGDFSATSISNYRSGLRKPGLKVVAGIAEALEISFDEVAVEAKLRPNYRTMDNEKDEKDIQRIRRFFSQMEPATRDNYIAVGETLARQDQKRRTTDEARTRPAKARP